MAFEGLSSKLNETFKRLRGKGRLSEQDVAEAMREVRLALLEADVSYKVVKDFVKRVSERAKGAEVLESLSPAQMVIKIVNEELCALMGSENRKLNISSRSPSVVMLVGLQGAGKTTNGAKLAALMKKSQNKRPLLVACDVYRPAAIKQLETVGAQLGIPVFQMGQGDPVEIAKASIAHAKKHGNDLVFLDTAGRLHIDEALMDELQRIKEATDPAEILLVVDAMTGQDAVNAASAFDGQLGITGVMLTKLDGDARGGAALSVTAVTGKPIKFAGVGEKLDQIEPFHPGPHGRPHPRHGRRAHAYREGRTGDGREKGRRDGRAAEAEPLHADGLLRAAHPAQGHGLDGGHSRDDGPEPQGAKGRQGGREGHGPHGGHHPLDDAEGAGKTPISSATRAKKRIAAGSGTSVMEVNRLLKQYDMMLQLVKQMNGAGGKKMKRLAKMGRHPRDARRLPRPGIKSGHRGKPRFPYTQ